VSFVGLVRSGVGFLSPKVDRNKGRKEGKKKKKRGQGPEEYVQTSRSLKDSRNVPFPSAACECSNAYERGELEILLLASTGKVWPGRQLPGSQSPRLQGQEDAEPCCSLPQTRTCCHQGEHQHTMPFSHPSSLAVLFEDAFLPLQD